MSPIIVKHQPIINIIKLCCKNRVTDEKMPQEDIVRRINTEVLNRRSGHKSTYIYGYWFYPEIWCFSLDQWLPISSCAFQATTSSSYLNDSHGIYKATISGFKSNWMLDLRSHWVSGKQLNYFYIYYFKNASTPFTMFY